MENSLYIINNEKCFRNNGKTFCENIEIKLLAEDLKKYFNLKLILRSSKRQSVHEINNSQISISSNIISFLIKIFLSIFDKNSKYLLISVTPYTFLSSILLFIFRKKTFLYLRSDGKKEINLILGKKYLFIYKFMENFMVKYSKVITVNNEILKNKDYKLVNPSSIDNSWFKNTSYPDLNKIKILYVGRLKIEKGVHYLTQIFSEFLDFKKDSILTLIGKGDEIKKTINQIKIVGAVSDKQELIKHFDNHNIVILPSFTEGHPRVLIESLARKRPIIIFDDISHIKKNFHGVYICKRNIKSFASTIDQIIKNYNDIQKEMEKNILPTKEKFILQLNKIIKNEY